jgi:signal transduction histidine kinase
VNLTALEQSDQYERLTGELYAPGMMPLGRALAGEVVRGEEVLVRLPGGARRIIRASGAPVLSADGLPLGGVVAFEDISEQKAAAHERERIAQFQEQFLGILGHDLRNPLSAITMAAEILAENIGAGENRLTTRITASADRMRGMIDQLLDLTQSRLGGGIVLSPTLVDLSAVTRNVVDELQTGHPHCKFDVQLDPIPITSWDEGRLEQVLSNIMSNAVVYGRPGQPVKIRLLCAGGHAVCEVHNENPDGREIPPELMACLFEPFRRGRNEHQRSQGLGLGLFIAREIVTAHHGRIEVQSSREAGTTFRINLPLGESSGAVQSAVAGG